MILCFHFCNRFVDALQAAQHAQPAAAAARGDAGGPVRGHHRAGRLPHQVGLSLCLKTDDRIRSRGLKELRKSRRGGGGGGGGKKKKKKFIFFFFGAGVKI